MSKKHRKNFPASPAPEAFSDFNISDIIKQNRWLILSVLILGLVVYLNSLTNQFVSDDIAEIQTNPDIQNLKYTLDRPFGFIRPLLYLLAVKIGGLRPIYFRLINILFHLGSIFLVYLIVMSLVKKKLVAFLTAGLLAIHPLLSEAVVWISGGSYVQYSFFFLGSFLFYIHKNLNRYFFWYSILLYLLSLLSHTEMAVVLPLIFIIYEISFGNLKKNWHKIAILSVLAAVEVIVSFIHLQGRIVTLQSVHYQEQGFDNPLIQIPIALGNYFGLLIWPKGLTIYHSELSTGIPNYVLMLILALIYFGLIVYFFIKDRRIFFWMSWIIIALSVTLLPFRWTWVVAERYFYLGSIGAFVGFSLLSDYLLNKFSRFKEVIYISLIIIFISLGLRTVLRNLDWSTADNLWLSAETTSPSSPTNHNNLGDLYGRRKDYPRAIQEFKTAILLKPNYGDAYHNLGNAYAETGDINNALINYQKAIEFNPALWQSYQNIASIYYSQAKYPESLDYIQKAIKINPQNPNLVYNLGIIYLKSGDKTRAIETLTILSQVFPNIPQYQQALTEAQK